jgi:two-component system response regulator
MSQPVAPKMILLVEDDPDHEALTMRALRRNNLGHQVTVARDGAAALDLLLGGELAPAEVRGPLPEVVVLDLKLPKIDGLEVLRRLRADGRTRLLPVVVMTSSWGSTG